ncbi:transporter substrate-binding domain-containing protein [Echinimonas agarilytica]|uniref:Transporter substrate-binding domain-containing protein n=1 Tax=Echinimonas agarilytica TaxID=1215918 RepID=A0AA41W7Y9_9GAMM|nr:transporter substrate-binding domain-containing protein [Echinimonas agarilytica]MCM2679979.1 transporter substrate-binding domain-containing protein [Echinimonas agarilytica]
MLTEKEYGHAEAQFSGTEMSEQQGLRALFSGQIDIAFLPTSTQREFSFKAVKVPLLQGMLGYRLLLTHSEHNDKFAGISSLQDLKNNAVAGFGLHWEDLRILYRNRIPVIASAGYQDLFAMLATSQIDYLPRGLNEIYIEIEQQSDRYSDLMINSDIALYYPFPRYFFVNRSNEGLARRLEKGLDMAIEDGSFKAIFEKHFSDVIQRVQSQSRHLIELQNPFLPDDLPPMHTDWWMPANHVSNKSANTEIPQENQGLANE